MIGELLKFDSEWFGVRIGRFDVDPVAASHWGAANHMDCVYCLVPVEEIWRVKEGTTDHNFRLVDVRVEFRARVEKVEKPEHIRRATLEDSHWIQEIARKAFVNTRFYNDTHLKKHLVDEMYANWIREAFARDDIVFVSEHYGFVTMTRDGTIGLIAVGSDSRNHGVGKALMTAMMNFGYITGLTAITVVTQGGNISAQRTFQACGFRSERTDLWLHRWYP
jgi:dTDP-4-amino-4,6-dideoxy-D-galactose acyltransferase